MSPLFRTLSAVFRTALATVADTLGVKRTANDVITNARQILHATAADHHDRVFLQVVAFTWDVAGNFKTVGKTHTSNFTKGRVRLLSGLSYKRACKHHAFAGKLQEQEPCTLTALCAAFESTG